MSKSIAEQIERAARIALTAGPGPWPLSTSETLSAALVLNRPDALDGGPHARSWTIAEALDRLGDDWVAVIPGVATKLREEGLIK